MTDKIHGFVAAPDAFLTGSTNCFTVTVANYDLTADTSTGDEAAHNDGLDKIIEAISTRAQPVLIGTVGATSFRFAVEHVDVFGDLTAFSTKVQSDVRAATGDSDITVAIAAFVF
jgi:hypothetical protein